MIKGFSMRFQSYPAGDWNALCPPNGRLQRSSKTGSAMKIRSFGLMLFLVAGAACSSLSRGSSTTDQSQPTIVQVDNLGFQDMDVYAVRSGQRVRIGLAPGSSKTNLTIPSNLVSGLTSLRFIADPIGGRRASVSQEITVAPGDTVVMTIPPG
jgi:hypothetical protein